MSTKIKNASGLVGLVVIISFFFLLPFIIYFVGNAVIYALTGELKNLSPLAEIASLSLRVGILAIVGLFVLYVFSPPGNGAGW